MKLFKRMTNLKHEKIELENNCQQMTLQLQSLQIQNFNLQQALEKANDEKVQVPTDLGAVAGVEEKIQSGVIRHQQLYL